MHVPIDESRLFHPVRIALLKVDDNRTRTDDAGGDLLVERISTAGHLLADRQHVAAELAAIKHRIELWVNDPTVNCVIAIGGTGLSPRDVTPEALAAVWDREIPGFGELFRSISA